MRVIRIGEKYSIATGEVETYDLLPVDYLLLDYGDEDDEEEEKVERPNATYMAFVKCKEKQIHYRV